MLVGEAVIVDVVGSAVITTVVNVTVAVLLDPVAVVPFIEKPKVAVPAVTALVRVIV
jgi:hypothetical protein